MSNDVKAPEFDPEKFGVFNICNGSSRYRDHANKNLCYMLNSIDDAKRKQSYIYIGSGLVDKVIEQIGSMVNIGNDASGRIYLWPGDGATISRQGNYRSATISSKKFSDAYKELVGDFRRLYLLPVINHGYVELIPTGERD